MSTPSATSVVKAQAYAVWSNLSFISGLYVALVYWWLILYFGGSVGELQNYLWVILLTCIPIIGGINGLFIARSWGGWNTIFGRGIALLSLGLVGWSLGDIVWSFYNIVLKVEVPYPSFADVGFFSIVPFWFIGMIYIARAGGARFQLRDKRGKALVIFIPVVVFIVSYYLFLNGKAISGDSVLATFFNIAYPLGDMLTASAALSAWILMKRFLGGRMRLPIIILICGFLFQYLADLSFSYASTDGTYYNADWIDLFYLTSQFVVSVGVALLSPKRIV
jgi:hypothetical protein